MKFFLLKALPFIRYGMTGSNHKHFAVILVAVFLSSVSMSPLKAENITIAALGDSLTQGYGLPVEEGLTAQLQAWLDGQDAGITILNAGVSGDTSTGGLQRVDWTLTPDVDAMIVTLGGNDMLRGIAPDLTRSNIEAIVETTQARGIPVLLVGLTAASNFGSAYKAEFDAIYPDVSAAHDTVYMENIFAPLLALGTWEHVLDTYMQRDGIHPNGQGVAQIVLELGPKVLELAERVAR